MHPNVGAGTGLHPGFTDAHKALFLIEPDRRHSGVAPDKATAGALYEVAHPLDERSAGPGALLFGVDRHTAQPPLTSAFTTQFSCNRVVGLGLFQHRRHANYLVVHVGSEMTAAGVEVTRKDCRFRVKAGP